MKDWRRLVVDGVALAWLAASAAAGAQAPADLRKIVAEQLLYPRDARYTLPASLPSPSGDSARNAEWSAVAEGLAKAGLIRLTHGQERTFLDGTEKSLDVVVPSMNLRYETTALNIVLGRWDVEVARAAKEGPVTIAHGKRVLVRRTRAYPVVVEALAPQAASAYSDHEARWEIRGTGAALDVVEKSR